MPINTERLDLFKYDVVADANSTFNITNALNDNWDKIDNQTLLKTQITNCILSASNGVATYSGDTVTVKQGLKVLIPNGRNADGTLKNIEYTVSSDASRDVDVNQPTANRTLYLFVNATEGTTSIITYIDNYNYYKQETQPFEPASGKYGFWYNPTTNIFKVTTNGGAWTQKSLARIGYYTCYGGAITSLGVDQPVELAKQQDIDGLWVRSSSYLIQNVSFSANYKQTFDISDYLPNDGNVYEVAINAYGKTGTTAYNITGILVSGGYQGALVMKAETQVSQSMYGAGTCIIPVSPPRRLVIQNSGGVGTGVITVQLIGYRKAR